MKVIAGWSSVYMMRDLHGYVRLHVTQGKNQKAEGYEKTFEARRRETKGLTRAGGQVNRWTLGCKPMQGDFDR